MEPLNFERSSAPPPGFDSNTRLYLRPRHLTRGPETAQALAQGTALPLAGGPIGFAACDVILRGTAGARVALTDVAELAVWQSQLPQAQATRVADAIARLTAPRTSVAGVEFDATTIMGVVNMTPDSFSDGGELADAAAALDRARAHVAAGAALIDVGGESTRPGAAPVPAEEERKRVLPVVEKLAQAGIRVSVDTRHAATMNAAVARGAAMINDISALSHDPDSLVVAAGTGVPVVLMHGADDPRTMQDSPSYAHAPLDVYDHLERRIEAAEAAGIPRARLIVDPGIGFAKTVAHNLQVLRWLSLYHGLGCPVLLGVSRKSFIGRLSGAGSAKTRLAGSLAAALAGLDRGVQMLRVHDVAETAQAVAIWRAIGEGG
jgi:dihydropteroate synthase